MQVIEVTDKSTAKDFLEVNALLNRSNPNYIRPLDNEVNDTFNHKKNKTYQYGETKRWIAKDDNGNLIGRIAAFTNSKYINKGTEFPTGGIGFSTASTTRRLPTYCSIQQKNGSRKKAWKPWTAPSILATVINGGD